MEDSRKERREDATVTSEDGLGNVVEVKWLREKKKIRTFQGAGSTRLVASKRGFRRHCRNWLRIAGGGSTCDWG